VSIFSIAKSKKLFIVLNLSSSSVLNAINLKTNSCPAILLLEIPTTSLKLSCSTFNRINTGGLSLKPQEIRQALNQRGGGVGFLKNMVEQDSFKEVLQYFN
jgi:hypothetical protein